MNIKVISGVGVVSGVGVDYLLFHSGLFDINCFVKIFMFSNQMIYHLGTSVASLFSILDVIVHT